MAAPKRLKIQARDIVIDNKTLEGVLLDLAEQTKVNAARTAQVDERCARAEEMAAAALQTIAAVSKDLQAMTQEMREANQEMREANRRADARLAALEKPTGA